MRAALALLLFAGGPVLAQEHAGGELAPRAPEQAAGQALMQCVAHATGHGAIDSEAVELLRANGLQYEMSPPPFLQAAAENEYGRGQFARAPSAQGQVWAVGYDSGVCIVMAIGTPAGPVETRLNELFAIPNSFKPEPIEQKPGARWSQWRWSMKPNDLVAQVNIRDRSGVGMVMVTVAPKPHGSK